MKIIETREKQLNNWLKTNQVKEVGDTTADGTGIITNIAIGNDHGRYLIKVKPINLDTDLGAGYGVTKVHFFNNESLSVIKNLNKVVLEHFGIDSIKENYLGKTRSAERNLFYYLFLELYYKDITEKTIDITNKLSYYTGLHRTSFNHNQKLHREKNYDYDSRIINGDYVYNHFYLLMEKLTGEDYSHKLKSKPQPKEPVVRKSKFIKVMETHSDVINQLIEEGCSAKDLNNKYFKYFDGQTLSQRMRYYDKPLFDKFSALKKSSNIISFKKILKENRSEIEDMLKKGLTLADVNEKFFNYNSEDILYRRMRTGSRSLNEMYVKHIQTRKKYKKEQENGFSVGR
ncbi:hypothetical protein N9924_00260 [bacterium]|nr:hypothetical protein [bacterium]